MYPIKERIRTITFCSDYATTFATLLSKLGEMDIPVQSRDEDKGKIVAHCLAKLANAIVWRCWSDTLVFEMKTVDERSTRVNIYAIPNFFKIRVKRDEKVIDLDELVSHLTLQGAKSGGTH